MARVEDLKTGAVGKVARFGVNGNGELVVDVHWITDNAPKGKSMPTDIVIRDTQRVVREDEMEEGMGHSHTIGHGENAKPEGYPETLQEDGIEEGIGHSHTIGKGTNAKPANYPENLEESKKLLGKKIVVENMEPIHVKLFGNKKRFDSILDSINEEFENLRVVDNSLSATDNLGTEWLFNISKVDAGSVKLIYTGIGK